MKNNTWGKSGEFKLKYSYESEIECGKVESKKLRKEALEKYLKELEDRNRYKQVRNVFGG